MAETKLEEARERLEATVQHAQHNNHVAVNRVSTADLRAILAELDRRSPPTGEGAVAWRVKDFADGWILFHSEREAHREAEGAGNLVQALYAAAPPPPDASRGLDREEVARLIDPEVWACRDRNPNSTPLTCHDIQASLAKADAIIALSAPAGGGFGPGARAGWGMAAATEDPATEPTDQSTTPGEKP